MLFPTHVGMDRPTTATSTASIGSPHLRGDGPCKMREAAKAAIAPHTRGDGPDNWAKYPRQMLVSPHAWGWPDVGKLLFAAKRVLPTRVGMCRTKALTAAPSASSPHSCGDGPHSSSVVGNSR